MRKSIYESVRGTSSLLVIAGLVAGPVASAQDCGSRASDLASRISAFKSRSSDENGKMEKDFSSATSSSYSSGYFKKFNDLNQGVTEASKLINKGYDLSGFTNVMSQGQKQTKLPPTVTNTMSNAVELAEAAADEDNAKLDLAQLRCSQSTEDAALDAFLKQADSGTASNFKSAKYNMCRIVYILADLQDKRQKLNDIRKNGYPLFYLHAKEKKSYSGHDRTIQFKVDLRVYPEYPDTASINGGDQEFLLGTIEGIRLSYNSYFKWSDNNWTTLNLYQLFMNEHQKQEICLPELKITSSVKAKLCAHVKNLSDTSITVRATAKFKYDGDWKSVSLGDQTIPAPFGYLADVSDMKEKKMQDLQSKVVDRLATMFGDFDDVAGKAKEWQQQCT